jgi:hypothetical protein
MLGKYFIGSFSQMGLSGPCRVLLALMCWASLCPDSFGKTSTQTSWYHGKNSKNPFKLFFNITNIPFLY